MTAVRYTSSDGLEIPAYLTLPKGVPAQKLPVIMLPARRPVGARRPGATTTYAQFLANRGYGVLQMNFRGSTGYGKKFLNAGNKEWGQKMQDDITWGVKHLISEGIADPEARRHPRRLLRRLRHARRRHLHAGRLRRGRLHRRPVEPDDPHGLHPAVLGSRPQGLQCPHGRPEDRRGQGAAACGSRRSTRREDQDTADGGAGQNDPEGLVSANQRRP